MLKTLFGTLTDILKGLMGKNRISLMVIDAPPKIFHLDKGIFFCRICRGIQPQTHICKISIPLRLRGIIPHKILNLNQHVL